MMKLTIPIFCFLCFVTQVFGQENTTKTIFSPTPSWVKKYPKPILKKAYEVSPVLVHDETQYNHITGERYYRYFYYMDNPNSLLSSFNHSYEPDYQIFHLHKVIIHRGNKSIELKDELHTKTIFYNEKIGTNQYGDDAKIFIYFDKVKVGDLVEIAFTKKGKQPDLQNLLYYDKQLESIDFIGTDYIRILNYPTQPIYHTLLNSDVKPTIQKQSDYNVFELITLTEERLKNQEYNGFIPFKKVFITNQTNWRDLVTVSLKNHQLEIPPSKSVQNKVKSLTKNITDKGKQITAILDFIQRDIEYLAYGLINPKRPEVTLDKGYGDCKSMSLLTIKMLECIDVKSYPVIVHTKGIDDRLIRSHAFVFDHEVIEFMYNGDTILFDATMDFEEGNSYKRLVNDFKYGLKIIEGINELTRFPILREGQIVYNETLMIKRSYFDELEYESEKEIKATGAIAERLYTLQKLGLKRMWNEGLEDYNSNNWCSFTDFTTQSHQYDESEKQFSITLNNNSPCTDYRIDYRDDILKIYPNLLKSWWKDFDIKEENLNFETLPFQNVTFNYKIVLPDTFSVESDSFFIKKGWVEYKQVIQQKGNIVYATYHIKILKSYLPHARFKEVRKTIDKIEDEMIIYLDKAYFEQEPKWKNPTHYIPLLISVGFLIVVIALLWLNFRTLIRRKKRIKALENEVESLKTELEGLSSDE